MIDESDRIEAAVVATFLARFRADDAAGHRMPLAHYLAAFPDWPDAIEREYRSVTGAADDDAEAAPTPRHRPSERLVDHGLIARGGMGEVRRVWDRELRRMLALKRLEPSGHGSTPSTKTQALTRFLDEAQITAQLDHPGIVPVHEFGIDDQGRVYFTMSLVRGVTFKEVLALLAEERGGWTQTRALHVLLRVCETVGFAHSQGVVHRDLKPANVMVGRFGEVYVMDWGLAHVLDAEDHRDLRIAPGGADATPGGGHPADGESLLTMDGDVVGTPAYMSPEQARGDVERLGPRTDVYAIGAMLYHVLTGSAPYVEAGSTAGPRALLARVVAGPPRALGAAGAPAVAAELVAICNRAMARDPEQRYADVQALAEDLRAYLEVRVVAAHRTGAWAELHKWMRRNRSLAAASALAIVALVGGLVASLVLIRRVEQQALRAKTNADWAFDAVDSLLTRIASEQLQDAADSHPLRRDLLQHAVRFQREFVAARRDDPVAVDELVRAHSRLAAIHVQLGEFGPAQDAVDEATRMATALLAEQPGRVDLAADLGWLRSMTACELLRRGEPDRAEVLFGEALAELRRLRADHPDSARTLRNLGVVLNNLAVVRRRHGAHDEVADLLAESAEVGRAAVAMAPSRESENDLASRLANLAVAYMSIDRDAEAEAAAAEQAAILDRLLAEQPTRQALLVERARMTNIRGELRRRAGETARARELFAAAGDQWRQLVDDHPDVPRYRRELAGARINQARQLRSVGDRAAAVEAYEDAAEQMQMVLRSDPRNRDHQERMRRAAWEGGVELARLRDHARVAVCAGRLRGLDQLGPRPRKDAAQLYCHCAYLTRGAADRSIPDSYRQRAVELIDALVAEGALSAEELAKRPWVWARSP